MFKKVFYFLKGYVIIKVEGKFPERFLNVAGRKNLLMWQVRPVSGGIVFCAPVSDFKKMQEISENTDCTVKLLKKVGFWHTVKMHQNRKALAIGVLVFVLVLFGMLSLLWDIRITGIDRIPEKQIRAELKRNGIYPFAFVYGINKTSACKNIVANNADISWIGIEIKGSRAFVEIVETVPKPAIQDKSVPCNLIADKSGVVTALEIESGVTMVKIGDTVTEGQLLVSGIADSSAQGVRFLHAEGEVYVKNWYQKDVEFPLTQKDIRKTGNRKSHFTVRFFGKEIPVWLNTDIPFRSAEQTFKYYGPVKRAVYDEVVAVETQYTQEEALKQAEDDYRQELLKIGKVEKIESTVSEQNNILHIHFTAEVTEKTGVKRMIERETDGENFTG
ncbi:MAG: sporulation protein YqfD [Clostridia bacterium]|nr:sporulation protein YqfD [Clostridia bacterium]